MNGTPKEHGLWLSYTLQPNDRNRNRIIEHYLPLGERLAKKAARKMPRNLIDVNDLIQTAAIAIMNCIDKYQPGRGMRFSTFCGQRIKGAFLDEQRRIDWMTRECRTAANRIRRMLDSGMSMDEVVYRTGMSEEEIRLATRSQEQFLRDAAAERAVVKIDNDEIDESDS